MSKKTNLDKLLKLIELQNIATSLTDEEISAIEDEIEGGYKLDYDSMQDWFKLNNQAYELINQPEEQKKDSPFMNSCTFVYPILSFAGIYLASRIAQFITRNGRAIELAIVGKDQIDPNTVDPKTGKGGKGVKETVAERVGDYTNYQILEKSDTWLINMHKTIYSYAFCGTGIKRIFYDKDEEEIISQFYPYEDVIINNKISCLSDAPRITLRNYVYLNDIHCKMKYGDYLEVDLDVFKVSEGISEDSDREKDSRDENPPQEIYHQMLYLDLDGDGYKEPYIAHFHPATRKLLGLYVNFDLKDVKIDQDGSSLGKIKSKPFVRDFHCIHDPKGNFWSLGLNHLLYEHNKVINGVCRQLVDAGTLANYQGGFKRQNIDIQGADEAMRPGGFKDIAGGSMQIPLADNFMMLNFKEPSQVLFALLGTLVSSAKEIGLVTDVLTGDAQMQNVPATTALAMIEQGTRAFAPIIVNLQIALKQEFKDILSLNHKHLNEEEYQMFTANPEASKEDFNTDNLLVVPVADPTMASEAQKYAKIQALLQLAGQQATMGVFDPNSWIPEYLEGLGYDRQKAEGMLSPPPDPMKDPQVRQAQAELELKAADLVRKNKETDIKLANSHIKQFQEQYKSQNALIKQALNTAQINKIRADTIKTTVDTAHESKRIDNERENKHIQAVLDIGKQELEHRKLNILARTKNKQ